ncbi:hypothetical protein LTR84_006394 [Exophiala bonariae]|uniref:SnoaL-like domain-containing protein n=1 Tax=Exophiala bonariae TaxID=1690606 RepID=A0AAV9N138_9EURO|nr:hypothetical protein LTR84_006394 [Exophiala bonariae]
MAQRSNYEFSNQSSIPGGLGATISNFFRSWDDPHSANDYLNVFAPQGKLVFGPAPATGREAIQALRDGMIHAENGPVVDLEHTLGQVFVLAGAEAEGEGSKDEHELLVNGSIWYRLKNGKKIDADFASYMKFVRQGDGQLQVELYIVYLDSLELVTAIKEMSA